MEWNGRKVHTYVSGKTSSFIPGGSWNSEPDHRRSQADILIPSRRGCLGLFVLQHQQAPVSRMPEYPQEFSMLVPLLLLGLALSNGGIPYNEALTLITP